MCPRRSRPPGERVAFTWSPGNEEDAATEVEVWFPAGEGGTRVDLVHGGWGHPADGAAARDAYERGWGYVLGRYVTAVTRR